MSSPEEYARPIFEIRNNDAADPGADAVLTARIAGGDPAAFDLLYRRLSLRLQRIAWLVCGDRAESADIVHDVFVTLWENARLYDGDRGSVFSWLSTITRHRAIDWVRCRQRRSALLCEFCIETNPREAVDESSADHVAAVNDEHRAVRVALAALPSKMKRALELTYFYRCSHIEVAAQLSEPVGTVKSRIRRGLHRLRGRFGRRTFLS